jgi:hypothetical protein
MITFDPAAAMAASIKGYGTKSATSASGLDSVMDALISVASCTASALVEGLSFQLPEMSGVRAMSSVTAEDDDELAVDRILTKAGAKAVAEAKQAESATTESFII